MTQHNATLQNPFDYQIESNSIQSATDNKSRFGEKVLSMLVAWGERVYEYRSTDNYQQYSRVRRYL